MKKKFVFALAVLVSLAPLGYLHAFSQSSAEDYLTQHPDNPWVTMALSSLGQSPSVNYISSKTPSSATDYASYILALTAVGQNPENFNGVNYVDGLKTFYSENQIGDASLVNDDIFGMLALESDNHASGNESIVADSKTFLLAHQNQDGGWGYSVGSSSDSNTTASAIVALVSAGVSNSNSSVQNALDYLKTAQNDDGGFTYDPKSSYGTASDTSSTSWVIWALDALSINPADWSKGDNDPIKYLQSMQDQSGFFPYQAGSAEDSFSPATTSYAVIALAGKTLPVGVYSSGTGSDTGSGSQEQTFAFSIVGSSSTLCSGKVAGPTALDIVKNASSLCSFTYHIQDTSYGPYLDQIGNDKASGSVGWMYLVNNQSPNQGAGSYTLKSGDSVLWYYGNPDNPPSVTAGSSSSSVSLSADVEQGDVKGANTVISFSINPSEINFGKLGKGDSSTKTITVTNSSTGAINISANVSGDNLFADNLKIDGSGWRSFSSSVSANSQQDYSLQLSLGSYSGANGSKSGTVVFWATAQ